MVLNVGSAGLSKELGGFAELTEAFFFKEFERFVAAERLLLLHVCFCFLFLLILQEYIHIKAELIQC
jgi:hypothetical protein